MAGPIDFGQFPCHPRICIAAVRGAATGLDCSCRPGWHHDYAHGQHYPAYRYPADDALPPAVRSDFGTAYDGVDRCCAPHPEGGYAMITLTHFLVVGACLFSIGLYAVMARRNAIMVLVGIELMINAAILNLVAFGRYDG